jgi:hypothetical protein
MTRFSSARWCVVVAVSLVVAACAGAEWRRVAVAPTYHAPRQLRVTLVAQASTEHSAEALQVMQEALADGLASNGITASFGPAPDDQPQASVTLAQWDQGSRALRYFVGFGTGEGSIVVFVKSPSADGQVGVEGEARGWVKGGMFGGSSYNAASEAGHLIAEAIATGRTK